jgi:prepilin-type N-terminal cleavage/methylation domain-containing protein
MKQLFFKNSIDMKGFTLVEMLVSSSIFASLVIMATGALFSAQALNTRVQQTQIILDGVNVSMETMVRDIRYGYNYHCTQSFSTTTPPANNELRRSCPLEVDVASNPTAFAGKALIFHPVGVVDDTARVAYFIKTTGENSSIQKATCNPNPPGPCVWASSVEQITGDDAYIDNLSFFVTGANSSVAGDGTNYGVIPPSDDTQPLITILVGGKTKPSDRSRTVPFSVQHSVISRTIDN